MKKLFVGFMVVICALFLSNWAQALNTTDTYWGGTEHGVSQSGDVIGDLTGSYAFAVNTLTATASNGNIQVVLSGPYFGSTYADNSQSGLGDPGDLYISSGGWKVSGTAPHYGTDTFLSSEGWNYVIDWDHTNGLVSGTSKVAYIYALAIPFVGLTMTSNESGAWSGFRSDQAYLGGGTGTSLGTGSVLLNATGQTLTITFPSLGMNPELIGYHWTMACGNDVVEGGGTPIPEPATMLLLGSGLIGLAGFARRKFKK